MKIQYVSDLHLEFPENHRFIKENPILPVAEVLILAGDIIPFAIMNKFDDFFTYLSNNFKKTYWIAGNHEYYHYDISKKSGSFIESIKPNVFLINNKTIVENEIRLIFTTLWSKISINNFFYIENRMNDFHLINNNKTAFTAVMYNDLHIESLDFLTKELDNFKTEKTIIITHHAPTLLNYPEKYKGDILNEAFAVELYDLIENYKPNYWIYGHTHFNTPKFKIGKTELVTNQLGYVKYGENYKFKSDSLIII